MIILTYLQVVPPKMTSRTLPNVAEEPMPYVSYQHLYNYKFLLKISHSDRHDDEDVEEARSGRKKKSTIATNYRARIRSNRYFNY